ncbi:MAG: hypothetical protein MZV64_18895 [Ignavibacteriales bacterium]|nr:hypothetical protein [Ignavibacteriales bacterium]
MLDLARDPRWGRTEGTYGEDPFLVSRLGVAAVLRGLQGERFGGHPEHVTRDRQAFRGAWTARRGDETAPRRITPSAPCARNSSRPFEAVVSLRAVSER